MRKVRIQSDIHYTRLELETPLSPEGSSDLWRTLHREGIQVMCARIRSRRGLLIEHLSLAEADGSPLDPARIDHLLAVLGDRHSVAAVD